MDLLEQIVQSDLGQIAPALAQDGCVKCGDPRDPNKNTVHEATGEQRAAGERRCRRTAKERRCDDRLCQVAMVKNDRTYINNAIAFRNLKHQPRNALRRATPRSWRRRRETPSCGGPQRYRQCPTERRPWPIRPR